MNSFAFINNVRDTKSRAKIEYLNAVANLHSIFLDQVHECQVAISASYGPTRSARWFAIPSNYRLATLHESGHTGSSNRRQLPCISIRRTPWNIDFLLRLSFFFSFRFLLLFFLPKHGPSRFEKLLNYLWFGEFSFFLGGSWILL